MQFLNCLIIAECRFHKQYDILLNFFYFSPSSVYWMNDVEVIKICAYALNIPENVYTFFLYSLVLLRCVKEALVK